MSSVSVVLLDGSTQDIPLDEGDTIAAVLRRCSPLVGVPADQLSVHTHEGPKDPAAKAVAGQRMVLYANLRGWAIVRVAYQKSITLSLDCDNAVLIVWIPKDAPTARPQKAAIGLKGRVTYTFEAAMPWPFAVQIAVEMAKTRTQILMTDVRRGPQATKQAMVRTIDTNAVLTCAKTAIFSRKEETPNVLHSKVFEPQAIVLGSMTTLISMFSSEPFEIRGDQIIARTLLFFVHILPAAVGRISKEGPNSEEAAPYRIVHKTASGEWAAPLSLVQAGLVQRVAAVVDEDIRTSIVPRLVELGTVKGRKRGRKGSSETLAPCFQNFLLDLPKNGLKHNDRLLVAKYANETDDPGIVFAHVEDLRPDLKDQLGIARRSWTKVTGFPACSKIKMGRTPLQCYGCPRSHPTGTKAPRRRSSGKPFAIEFTEDN